MSFSDWFKGHAAIAYKKNSSIYVLPTSNSTKPIKVVFEDTPPYERYEVRGGPGNPLLLRWDHDGALIYEGVQYSFYAPIDGDDIESSDIENLL